MQYIASEGKGMEGCPLLFTMEYTAKRSPSIKFSWKAAVGNWDSTQKVELSVYELDTLLSGVMRSASEHAVNVKKGP